MKQMNWMVILVAGVLSAGCMTTSRSGEVYTRDQARRTQTVQMGTVESVKNIRIEGTRSGIGAIAGGVAGGVIGSTIGGGTGTRLATLGGAAAGAAGGHLAEERMTRRDGLEILVNLDNGTTIAVVQEADVMFSPGDRVRVLTGSDGTSRVSR